MKGCMRSALCARQSNTVGCVCSRGIVRASQMTSSLNTLIDSYAFDTTRESGPHVLIDFVSTSYHLCNLNDIHVRSPGESVINGLLEGVRLPIGDVRQNELGEVFNEEEENR